MNKIKLLVPFIIILSIHSALYSEISRDDFFVDFDNITVNLGDSFDLITSTFGSVDFTILHNPSIKLRVYKYDSFTVYTSNYGESPQELMIYGISFSNVNYSILKGIHIGQSKDSIINLLGSPEYDKNNSIYYYNNDYDVLEIKISFNSDMKIQEIRIFMGT